MNIHFNLILLFRIGQMMKVCFQIKDSFKNRRKLKLTHLSSIFIEKVTNISIFMRKPRNKGELYGIKIDIYR